MIGKILLFYMLLCIIVSKINSVNMKKVEEKPQIFYANKFLQLGKGFSVQQLRALHFVVTQLQAEMYRLNQQKVQGLPLQRTLFGDVYFRIPTNLIDPSNQDEQIRKALRGLIIPIDDKNFVGNFMLSAKREGGNWVLLFPEKTVNYLTEISKGVTPLETILYMSAQSKYTIRIYELLKRFADTGFWYTTPEEISYLFELPKMYRNDYGKIKKYILEVARKELYELYRKNRSEIYFNYEEKRGGRGNKVKELKFTIFWSQKNKENRLPNPENKDFIYIKEVLTRIMVEAKGITKHQKEVNIEFINKALSKLSEKRKIKEFADKLENKIMQNGKVDDDKKGALARYILENDYGIE